MTPEERARRCAEAMWSADAASKSMGFQLDEIGEGRAVMSMTVEPQHLNGHGICHGGIIFALADSAFAFACNSRNVQAVAQHNSISYLAPGRLADRLVAVAVEVSLAGRSGIYDVRVTRGEAEAVAVFRGASRLLSGSHFDE
ncbi:MAG: hydroxyphenylacetyl-CoA thioesterase PaaI [Rhodobacteraceae bacterium]|nr:hydroxyphenylacetyl-CoA thioesterase PaaI [Paracoccaceae bacterium]